MTPSGNAPTQVGDKMVVKDWFGITCEAEITQLLPDNKALVLTDAGEEMKVELQ